MKELLKKWTRKENECLTVFAIGVSLGIFLLLNYMTRGASTLTVLFTDVNDNYMDFFHSLIDAACENPYTERHVIYPPLCYVIYRIFGHMIPQDYYLSGSLYIRSTMEGMFSFLVYILLSLLALYFFSKQYARNHQMNNRWPIRILMFSAPLAFSLQRGNFIILTVACLTAFLCYKDDASFVKRQFAFLMLAVAANIKIYPAVFGLLLVSQKRWRDCLCCIGYGILLFILPMFFFGGLSSISVLINNIFRTTGKFSVRLGTRVDIDNLFSFLSAKGILTSIFAPLMGKTLILGTGILLACYFCMDEEWERILCLTLICTFIPGFSYMYNLTYLIPLLITSVGHNKKPVFILTLLCFIYYPLDISSVSWFHVEGATLLPRLWDVIASLSGVALIGYAAISAGVSLAVKLAGRKIRFHADENKQIVFNAGSKPIDERRLIEVDRKG